MRSAKFLRAAILMNICERLLLHIGKKTKKTTYDTVTQSCYLAVINTFVRFTGKHLWWCPSRKKRRTTAIVFACEFSGLSEKLLGRTLTNGYFYLYIFQPKTTPKETFYG